MAEHNGGGWLADLRRNTTLLESAVLELRTLQAQLREIGFTHRIKFAAREPKINEAEAARRISSFHEHVNAEEELFGSSLTNHIKQLVAGRAVMADLDDERRFFLDIRLSLAIDLADALPTDRIERLPALPLPRAPIDSRARAVEWLLVDCWNTLKSPALSAWIDRYLCYA